MIHKRKIHKNIFCQYIASSINKDCEKGRGERKALHSLQLYVIVPFEEEWEAGMEEWTRELKGMMNAIEIL